MDTFSQAETGSDEAFGPAPLGSEFELRQLLETLPAGAYICDNEGLITYFNERAVEMWGRGPELNSPVDRF